MTSFLGADPLAGAWTFWADRAVPPHTPLGAVAVTDWAPTWKLSGFGSSEATLPVAASAALTRDDMIDGLWRWRLWSFYAPPVGQPYPVWAGLPTGVVDEGAASVTLSFVELHGYLNKRVLETATHYREPGTEQTTIARALAQPVEDVGVVIVTNPGPGKTRVRSYEPLEGPVPAPT